MPQPFPPARVRVPTWFIVAASLAICLHLGLVGLHSLATVSGPWGMSEEPMAPPPQFAMAVDRFSFPAYLLPLRLTHTYHFATNRPETMGIYFEARLKDESGKEIARLRFPEEGANPWVRNRENILAQLLGDDMPLPPPQGEVVAAPGKAVPRISYWQMTSPGNLEIRSVEQHLVPRDRPVMQPNPWALLLSRSYARYLCRSHGAASAEIIRHSKRAIPPEVLVTNLPGGEFEELVSNFGELPR
jgi:hypothetical protein